MYVIFYFFACYMISQNVSFDAINVELLREFRLTVDSLVNLASLDGLTALLSALATGVRVRWSPNKTRDRIATTTAVECIGRPLNHSSDTHQTFSSIDARKIPDLVACRRRPIRRDMR
jgi:hypothetical protein